MNSHAKTVYVTPRTGMPRRYTLHHEQERQDGTLHHEQERQDGTLHHEQAHVSQSERLGRVDGTPASLREVLASNFGPEAAYSDVFRDFPQSLQEHSTTVP
jgi:hypothetical protein